MTSKWAPLAPVPGSLAGPAADIDASARPVPPVEPGAVVADKYRIDRVVGFGGMGIVCAASHLELGTALAVKFVRPERASDDRAVARFLTEARAAAQLKSQFACSVIDCGRLPSGTPYLVMEYLVGADLRSMLSARGPLAFEAAIRFTLQACEALAEAHGKHIVHRDIKPENLFLTEAPDGTPMIKVLDFGISKQVGPMAASRSLTEPTESIGSPFHMSPEQMIDPAGVDSRTDIWSIGVVLYELVTGQLPFTGNSTPQICANVMTTEPIPPRAQGADIPEALERVILRCLQKDRQRRFRDVAELSAALKEIGAANSPILPRVEWISERSPGAAPVKPRPPRDDEVRERVPGVPRRGLFRRAVVASILVPASGLAVYAWLRVSSPAEPLPAPLPVALPSAEPSALPGAASASTNRGAARPVPSRRAPALPQSRRSAVSSAASRVPLHGEPKLETELPPEPRSGAIYPETRPLPDLPPPE